MLQSVITDLRYAWRMSRRAPVVTISVTLAIALGIAASTAIFSVMEGVFLRPLPFPAPDRLVRFSTTVANFGTRAGGELPRRAGLEGRVDAPRSDRPV